MMSVMSVMSMMSVITVIVRMTVHDGVVVIKLLIKIVLSLVMIMYEDDDDRLVKVMAKYCNDGDTGYCLW